MTDYESVWNALNKLTTMIESKYNTLGPRKYDKDEDWNIDPVPHDPVVSRAQVKNLIISTGDISDIDGFFALNKYARSGADVLFIINYPAYIREYKSDINFETQNPGLGFKYDAQAAFGNERDPKYIKFMQRYSEPSANQNMKRALTDIAFEMAKKVWHEAGPSQKGHLFFCIGGVNSINPFAAKSIKNEVLVYAPKIDTSIPTLNVVTGVTYDHNARPVKMDLKMYSNIYMDFNGSMAFWNSNWADLLTAVVDKIRGVFIMGGIYSAVAPLTMPAIPGILNRFSCATMNQLYHPANTAAFFNFIKERVIPTFIITNNVVGDLTTYTDESKKTKTNEGLELFFYENVLNQRFLHSMALLYYGQSSNPPRKPFDFYTALALTTYMDDPSMLRCDTKQLFFDDKYGITLVSNQYSWSDTIEEFTRNINTTPVDGDPPFIQNKKISFINEIKVLRATDPLSYLQVRDVQFRLEDTNKMLHIK